MEQPSHTGKYKEWIRKAEKVAHKCNNYYNTCPWISRVPQISNFKLAPSQNLLKSLLSFQCASILQKRENYIQGKGARHFSPD